MMLAGNLFDTIDLENGLKIQLWDLSRKLAGGRWLVSLEIRIDIPLMIENLQVVPEKEKAFSVLRTEYGDRILYTHKLEKHFVEMNRKEKVFGKFMEIVRKDILQYLSHPDFANKFTMSTYKKFKTQNPQLFM